MKTTNSRAFRIFITYGWIFIVLAIILTSILALNTISREKFKTSCTSLDRNIVFRDLKVLENSYKFKFVNNTEFVLDSVLYMEGKTDFQNGKNWKPLTERVFFIPKPEDEKKSFSLSILYSLKTRGQIFRADFTCFLS